MDQFHKRGWNPPPHQHRLFKVLALLLFSSKTSVSWVWCLEQSWQSCPSAPQATFLDSGRFLNFIKIIGHLHEATSINLPQLCCLKEAATMRLPQLLLNNEVTFRLRLYQENVLTLLGIILFWFLTHSDRFRVLELLQTIENSGPGKTDNFNFYCNLSSS